MNNAVKYTFHGQIIVVMKGFMRDRMKYLKVKIQDTGVGISQEHKPHLFKMFGLVDQTPNNKKSGTYYIYIYIYLYIYIYITV